MFLRSILVLAILPIPCASAVLDSDDFVCVYDRMCDETGECEDTKLTIEVNSRTLLAYAGEPTAALSNLASRGFGSTSLYVVIDGNMVPIVFPRAEGGWEIGFIHVDYTDHVTASQKAASIWKSGQSIYTVRNADEFGLKTYSGKCVPGQCSRKFVVAEFVVDCEVIE